VNVRFAAYYGTAQSKNNNFDTMPCGGQAIPTWRATISN